MQRFAIISGMLLGVLSLSAHAFCRGGPGVCYMPPCPAGMGCAQNIGPMINYVAQPAPHVPDASYMPTASMPSITSMNSALTTRMPDRIVTNNGISAGQQTGQAINGANQTPTAAK